MAATAGGLGKGMNGGNSLGYEYSASAISISASKDLTLGGLLTILFAKAGVPEDKPKETSKEGYKTTKEATEAANKLGFEKTNYKSHGQPVYKNGSKYLTPDVDAHNGGVWKMADSLKNLGSKNTRMGTYDINLNRIGD